MSSPITDADRQEIRAFYAGWSDALLEEAYGEMLELYTDDAVMMPPNHPALRGREEILGFMQGFPPVSRVDFDVHEIEGYGDLAYVTGSYAMTLEPEGAPGPVEDRGTFIEIRRKEPDGRWLLSRDIFNSDLDAPGG